jgi:asparagine synthase (glutamine-hydrolysing)
LRRFDSFGHALPARVKRAAVMLEQRLPTLYRAQWPLRAGLGVMKHDPAVAQYATIRFFYSDEEKRSLFTPEFANSLGNDGMCAGSLHWLDAIASHVPEDDWVNWVSYLELRSYMADVLLRDADAMSMAHSLEVRVPLIDHKLVEFVLSLPGNLKSNGHFPAKRLLIESVKDLLPSQLLYRRKKGFAFPMGFWLRDRDLRDIVEDCLSEQSVRNRGILSWPAVRRAKQEFYRQTQFGNSGQVWLRVWIPTVLELWCRAYLDTIKRGAR